MPDPRVTLIIGLLLVAAGLLVFWPGKGLAHRWQRLHRLTNRVLSEDALKHIHEAERRGQPATLSSVAGTLQIGLNRMVALLTNMEHHGLVTTREHEVRLTPSGRQAALHVIRTHRLWERHLADTTGYAEAEWHEQAERREHDLSQAEANALDARLGHPTHDPHGDPIPTAAGELAPNGGRPLTTLAIGGTGRIVHIEDEPEAVYAQLMAEGLYPGQIVRLLELSPHRVRFWAGGDEHVVAPIVAASLTVAPSGEAPASDISGEPLSHLQPDEIGTVVYISPRCRGAERRRLMDLGIVPGTVIRAELRSPGADPTAYRIRGAVIALRREQAALIRITRGQVTTP